MGGWEAKLSEQKLAIAEAARADGTFREMSNEKEREYWQNILRTIDRNSHDGLSVRKRIADEGLSIEKQAYEARIEQLKLEREELELNFSRRTEVAVKAYQETVARYGQESKEAIKAYEIVLSEHRKFVEQKRAIDLIAAESRGRLVLAGVEFERRQMQQELADGAISKLEALESERQFEGKLFVIREAALNERKGLVDPEKDPVALAQINGEIELLELQHQNRLKEISGAAQRERDADVTNTARTIQQSWAGLISQLAKGAITIGSFIKGVFQSVATAVIDTLAQLAAKYVIDLILKRVLSKSAAAAQITDNAAVAGAAATASAAAIPFVGWAMAPEAGAAAYGSALAYMAGLSSAAGGFDIPGNINPIVQTHAKEMILPAKHADVIRAMADNGVGAGGSAVSQGPPPVLREISSNEYFVANRRELVKVLKAARRDFEF